MAQNLEQILECFSESRFFEFPDAVVFMDPEGEIIRCNKKTVLLFRGTTLRDIQGSSILRFTAPSAHKKARATVNRVLRGTIVEGNPILLSRMDGSVFPGEVSVSPVADEEGKMIGTVAIIMDVSQQREIQKKMEEQEKKYRLLFNQANDSIFLMDQEIFIDCNPKTLELFCCSREDIIGHSPIEFSPALQPDGRSSDEKALEKIEAALANKNQFFEWMHCRKDKTPFDAEVSLNCLDIGGKRFIQAIVRDITDRKEAEKSMQIMTQDLKELNEAKDKFFSIIAHDLKGPFNAILGFSEILTTEWDVYEDNELKHFIKNIQNSASRAYKLLLNLLEWSRSQTGRLENFPSVIDISGIINETILLHRSYADNKGVKLFSAVDFNTLVYADENMLKTVLRNLIENAIKYTPQGGRVTVNADQPDIDQKGDRVIISVRDNGIGIPEDEIPGLFAIDKQFQTPGTNNEKGTGLGLLLCKELVEKSHGQIFVESKTGKGSRFSFTIPTEEMK